MPFKIKDKIFDLFTSFDKSSDETGLLERFNKMVAEDLDTNEIDLLFNMFEKVLIPQSIITSMIPYLEGMLGLISIIDNAETRRRVLANILDIYRVKGTILSYKSLFTLLGFTKVTVEEHIVYGGFDTPLTLDDASRTLDSGGCNRCVYYDLALEGTLAVKDVSGIVSRALWVIQPINASYNKFSYNSSTVTLLVVTLLANGDLAYQPSSLGEVLEISGKGDLLINNTGKNVYKLQDGNLIEDIN